MSNFAQCNAANFFKKLFGEKDVEAIVELLDGQIVRRGDEGRLERRLDIFARRCKVGKFGT